MRIFLVCIALIILTDCAVADVRVKSHIRKNGSYVSEHYRTKQNKSKFDNYSSFGRINPHTGKFGTKMPW